MTVDAARRRLPLGVLLALLAASVLAALGVGAVSVPPAQILAILAHRCGLDLGIPWSPMQDAALVGLRAPRVLLGVGVGASLAVSGGALQGLLRNPLADPQLLGVSAGAAVGAAGVLTVTGGGVRGGAEGWLSLAVPAAAFAGGLGAVAAVRALAGGSNQHDGRGLLLAGIALNALCGALLGLLLHLADEPTLRAITAWTLGSLGGATWGAALTVLPLMLLGAAVCLREGAALNALALGTAEAGHLGIDVARLARRVSWGVALAVGAGVAITGILGFVGLVVPHLFRLAAGPDHTRLLPGAGILGAALLVAADLGARTALSPRELPVGVVTALVGAPFFLWLLRRGVREGQP